jgi:hypothetical protein
MTPDLPQLPATPRPRPRLIAGVYNYCDAWCARCVFQQQCRVYLDRQKYEAALAEGEEAVKRLDERDAEDEYEYEDDGRPPVTEAQKAEFFAIVEAANNYQPTPDEARRMDAAYRRKSRLQKKHPLTLKGRAYMNAVLDIREPLAALLAPLGDPLIDTAFEAITHHAWLIGAKTHRATSGLVGDDEDDEDDLEERLDVQSDSNGCAKLLRLVIAESRNAWSVLFTTPALSTEGVPAAMLERLEELDAALQKHFPRAMEFVRAGFDDRVGGEEAER